MFYVFHECPLIRYCRTKKPGRGNFHFVNDLNAEVLGILMAAGSEKKKNKERIRTTAENGSFNIFTYCGSLRGYETP